MENKCTIRSPYAHVEEDEQMKEVFKSTGFFYDWELKVVNEMIDDAASDGGGLYWRVAVVDNKIVGVAIFTKDTMSLLAWDIYWIAVHKDYQGMHIGKKLLQNIEKFIAKKKKAQVYIETCSRPLYEPTRQFYLKNGYILEATLKDYYAEGDSKCIFSKSLE